MVSREMHAQHHIIPHDRWQCETTKHGASGCVFLDRVFKDTAQDNLKSRFLKTGFKEKRASCVLYAGP